MKYAIFPKSGRKLSKLGFGAMGFAGWFGDQPKATHIASLLAALEQGVNVIDTARAYGDSEKIVGEALRQWSGEPPFLATKIQGLGPKSQWGWPTDVEIAFPPGHIRADCERCLRELGVEQVDLIPIIRKGCV